MRHLVFGFFTTRFIKLSGVNCGKLLVKIICGIKNNLCVFKACFSFQSLGQGKDLQSVGLDCFNPGSFCRWSTLVSRWSLCQQWSKMASDADRDSLSGEDVSGFTIIFISHFQVKYYWRCATIDRWIWYILWNFNFLTNFLMYS